MGSSADWAPIATRYAAATGRATICIDLPGHGESPLDPAGGWEAFAAALVDVVAKFTERPFDLVGYSMGGRLALVTSRLCPSAIRSLTLIGAHPGLRSNAEQSARRAQDETLAGELVAEPLAFLDAWEKLALFGPGQASAWAEVRRRRRDSAPHASPGWADALRTFTVAGQPVCWDRTHNEPPIRFLAGARDEKYCKVGREFAALGAPRSFHAVADAAHAAHLDQADIVLNHLLNALHTVV